MTPFDCFPNLKRAALEIAYDNGMINRSEPETDFLAKAAKPIEELAIINLIKLEVWLAELTDEQMSTLCAGEETDMKELVATAPSPQFICRS